MKLAITPQFYVLRGFAVYTPQRYKSDTNTLNLLKTKRPSRIMKVKSATTPIYSVGRPSPS